MTGTTVESAPLGGDPARAVFGQVMGLVALALGWLALGVFLLLLDLFGGGRD
jgi:hypothetical protein